LDGKQGKWFAARRQSDQLEIPQAVVTWGFSFRDNFPPSQFPAEPDRVVAMLARKRFASLPGLLLFSLLVVGSAPSVFAQEQSPPSKVKQFFTKLKKRIDLDPQTSFFGIHDWKYKETEKTTAEHLARTGCPQQTAPWAVCQDESKYSGYYVGGGAAFGGEPRVYNREGTWGWDYSPWWSTIRLNWFHGRRFQAGEGQYNPDTNSDPLDDFRNP
jgi:hypothetical protein